MLAVSTVKVVTVQHKATAGLECHVDGITPWLQPPNGYNKTSHSSHQPQRYQTTARNVKFISESNKYSQWQLFEKASALSLSQLSF